MDYYKKKAILQSNEFVNHDGVHRMKEMRAFLRIGRVILFFFTFVGKAARY